MIIFYAGAGAAVHVAVERLDYDTCWQSESWSTKINMGAIKHEGSIGDAEASLLLYEEELNHLPDCEISSRPRGSLQPHCQISDSRAAAIILGFQCLESLAFTGIATNLVMYLSHVHHERNAVIVTRLTAWAGTCYFTPFLGAIVADSYWGSYRMILFSSLVYLTGMVIVTLSASLPYIQQPPCEGISCLSTTWTQKLVFYIALYLIAFGSGGVKSSLLPLGANQFDDENPVDRLNKESFFNWFYVCISAGSLISTTLIVWIQENINWAVGFGIATISMAIGLVSFICGRSTYRQREARGSPLKGILQVFIASLQKIRIRAPTDSIHLFEVQDHRANIQGMQKLPHTDEFRFLDKAATVTDFDMKDLASSNTWRLCTITQVEEAKTLLRLFPIWVTGIIYSVVFAQINTTFIEQGKAMDSQLGPFSIPPASLFAFEVLSVTTWVFLYDTFIVRFMRSYLGSVPGLIQLVRMGIGYFLMIIVMATAAIVEVLRLKSSVTGKSINIMWQLPQYCIIGTSEVFSYIGLLEFLFDQGSDTMRSMSTAFYLLTMSIGSYLSSLVVVLVTALTARGDHPGWIPDNLDEGHLNYFFWLMAGLSALNLVVYISCAKRYRLKKVIMGCSTSN